MSRGPVRMIMDVDVARFQTLFLNTLGLTASGCAT
jgi:hypothetical protein